jgi:hypothetical protein
MKLRLAGRQGSQTVDWSGYALVRDNIQHFVEGGEPSARFAALHAIERAVDGGHATVDASRLRGEVLRAWYALARIPLDRAAVSLRTRAILTGSSDRPAESGTFLARQIGWKLPTPEAAGQAVVVEAKRFILAVLELTERSVDGDTIAVQRLGASPRFATGAPLDARAAGVARRPGPTRFALQALLAAALSVACSSGWTMPPKTPPDVQAEKEATTNVEQKEREDEREPVVAPPPAYGNKVVRLQARGDGHGVASRH